MDFDDSDGNGPARIVKVHIQPELSDYYVYCKIKSLFDKREIYHRKRMILGPFDYFVKYWSSIKIAQWTSTSMI